MSPVYKTTAFGPPYKNTLRMTTGIVTYLFGRCDAHTEPFRFAISQIAGTGSTATATVKLLSGGGGIGGAAGSEAPNPIPVTGAVMGVRGLSHTGFNTDPTTVGTVTLDSTGAGTITYSNATTQTAIADVGELVVWPYEYPDLVAQGTASIPVAQTFTPDDSDNSRCLFADVSWSGTSPSAATVVLEGALIDQDALYYVIKNAGGVSTTASVAASDALATIAGSAVTQNGALYQFIMAKFLRVKVTAMTGGDGTTSLVVRLFP
jgi:hypothetical protein